MNKSRVTLRRLIDCEDDYKLITKWYQNIWVYKYFEQRVLSYDEVLEKYKPRTNEKNDVVVDIIQYDDLPVGIIQYKLVKEEDKNKYKIDNINCYEIDIFIGENNYHNRGIGSKSIKLLIDYLYKDKNAEVIVMCPLKENIRAIKCYLNVGFEEVFEFEDNDTIGDKQTYILMKYDRKKITPFN